MTALTDEEKIVLQMYCQGYNTAAIDRYLGLKKEHSIRFIHSLEKSMGQKGLEALVSEAVSQELDINSPFGQWADIRERQEKVLEIAAKGKTNKEIAKELGISKAAVDGHFERIYNLFVIWHGENKECSSKNAAIVVYLKHKIDSGTERMAA